MPLCADDEMGGWYLGLGGGFSGAGALHADPTSYSPFDVEQHDAPLITGTIGYRLPVGLRLELELGHNSHGPVSSGSVDYEGHTAITSTLFNGIFDWNVGGPFSISTGFGLGIGSTSVSIAQTPFSPGTFLLEGSKTGFMWQGIFGVNYQVAPQFQIFADYRHREVTVEELLSTYVPLTPVRIGTIHENVAMFGLRWFLTPPPPPPPPPPTPG